MESRHGELAELFGALPGAQESFQLRDPLERALLACAHGTRQELINICQAHPEVLGSPKSCLNPEHHDSLLGAASRSRSIVVFNELLSMGAWPSRADHGEEAIEAMVKRGCPDEPTACLWLCCLSLGDVDLVKAAAAAIERSGRLAPNWRLLARQSLAAQELRLALDIFDDQGLAPDAQDLEALFEDLERPTHFWNALHCGDDPREDWRASAARSQREILDRSAASPPRKAIDLAWTEAVIHGSHHELRWMASKNWLPQGWMAVADDQRLQWRNPHGSGKARLPAKLPKRSLIEAAWANGHRDLAKSLAQIPDALKALRKQPPPPERLKDFTSSELVQLRDWGVDIFATDKQGQNFLHLWAAEDGRKPRSGWAAIAKVNPGALEAADNAGHTPIGAQMNALPSHGPAREEFAKLAANIAKRELRHAAEPAPKTPKASRARL